MNSTSDQWAKRRGGLPWRGSGGLGNLPKTRFGNSKEKATPGSRISLKWPEIKNSWINLKLRKHKSQRQFSHPKSKTKFSKTKGIWRQTGLSPSKNDSWEARSWLPSSWAISGVNLLISIPVKSMSSMSSVSLSGYRSFILFWTIPHQRSKTLQG